jgi:hypothetical protein
MNVFTVIAITLGLYFALGLRRFLLFVFIPAMIGLTIYFSWYHFSGQDEKDKATKKQEAARMAEEQHQKELQAKLEDETRRVEWNARIGYRRNSGLDPTDTSPLGVFRFEYPEYDDLNDEDLVERIRSHNYPTIPKEKFNKWARDPYGQEEIDHYLEEHKP